MRHPRTAPDPRRHALRGRCRPDARGRDGPSERREEWLERHVPAGELGDRLRALLAAAELERAERRAEERYPPEHPNRCRVALAGARLAAISGRGPEAIARARAACDRFVESLSPRSELVRDYRSLVGGESAGSGVS